MGTKLCVNMRVATQIIDMHIITVLQKDTNTVLRHTLRKSQFICFTSFFSLTLQTLFSDSKWTLAGLFALIVKHSHVSSEWQSHTILLSHIGLFTNLLANQCRPIKTFMIERLNPKGAIRVT